MKSRKFNSDDAQEWNYPGPDPYDPEIHLKFRPTYDTKFSVYDYPWFKSYNKGMMVIFLVCNP